MPHKFKQPKTQQHHRNLLPHVTEEVEGEEEEDEARHGHLASVAAMLPSRPGKQPEEAQSGVTFETPLMEPKYGRIECSPLPLQRALLSSATNRKCGPSTPVPLWKMYDNPLQDAIDSAKPSANAGRGMHPMQNGHLRASVSARKLAASLWEMQGAPKPQHRKGKEEFDKGYSEEVSSHNNHEGKETDRHVKGEEGASQHVKSMANHHRHQHHREGRKESSKHHKPAKGSRKDAHGHSPVTQVEADTGSTSFVKTPSTDERKIGVGGEDESTLSRELVKVLNQIWLLEEQHTVSTSMVDALRSDLKKTKARVQELRTEQSCYQEDMEMLINKLASEKSMLQDRTQQAILAAIKPLQEELETERKSKSKLESKHKKLSKEMGEARKTLAKTMQEFEREQKARELMEDVCDELAREISEDKAKVEELKQQSAKYREEVEQERQMLQMAEVWREERVQMKLAEARLELEEKNTALDKLRGELEAFLRAKRSYDEGHNVNKACTYDQVPPSGLQGACKQPTMDAGAAPSGLLVEKEISGHNGELNDNDDDDSFEDDLHSIELNRRSVSGSHEDSMWVHGNGSIQKAMAQEKTGVCDSVLLSPSMQAMGFKKQEDVRVSKQAGIGLMAESMTNEIQEAEPHMIGKGFHKGMKDWDLGERSVAWSSEGLANLWQRNTEEGRDSSLPKGKGKSELAYLENLSRNGSKHANAAASFASSLDVHGNGDTALRTHVFEFPQNRQAAAQDGEGGLPFSKQSATFPSSPTRQWAHSWSSPDPESTSKILQALKDWPPGFKENSLKARLLEAKLEGQQEKLRNSQVH